jgi:hypothetical protein
MAKILFETSGPFHNKKSFIPTWLKIEFYSLFFSALPHLITLGVWFAIAVAFYGAVLLI